jgi:uncharacterized protein YukE
MQWIRRHKFGLVTSLVLIGAGVFVLLQPYAIPDWIKLYGYTPPPAITTLAKDTTMTSAASRLLYVNHSAIEEKVSFRQHCPQADEKTIVIGCYHSGQKGIFILSVTDERLHGVEQVTTAHEMLHAAYERLSNSEKKRVDAMLTSYQQNGLTDQRVISAIESYKKSEPGQELNEMHSMFGTEIGDLPQDLEQYYGQYFTSRKTVVDFADQYQDAFTSRESAINEYDTQLKDQEAEIKANTRMLEPQASEIEQERSRLDNLHEQQSIIAYNAGVAPFNAKVIAYNDLLETTKKMISNYNALVEKRNAIAAQTVELQQAISSSSLPGSQ